MNPSDAATWFPLWLRQISVHQDFAWAVVMVAWGWCLLLWSRHPERRRDWGWLPGAAVAGVLAAAVQFLVFDPTFD